MNFLAPSARSVKMKGHSPAIAAIVMLLAADVAIAELYRCVRADGSTVYTDSQATCPGARAHHLSREVQSFRAVTPPQPKVSRSTGRASLLSAPAGGEARWRMKKHQTREELIAVGMRLEKMHPYVKICNRGGELYRTQRNGLRKSVSCQSLRDEVANLEGRRAELQEYLDHGIREDCRKSGCLPGWLR